jgi:hypothetical protein
MIVVCWFSLNWKTRLLELAGREGVVGELM